MPKKATQKVNSNSKNTKNVNKKSNSKSNIKNKNNKKSNNDFNAQLKKMLLDQLISKLK